MSEWKRAILVLVEKWRSQVVLKRVHRSLQECCFLKAHCDVVKVFVSSKKWVKGN